MTLVAMIVSLADTASSSLSTGVVAAIIVAAVLLVLGVGLATRRRRVSSAPAPELSAGEGREPDADVLAARVESEVPVEITDGMSLREIKQARSARLSRDYLDSEASRADKDRRKGKGGPPPSVDESDSVVPSEPAESTSADAAPATPPDELSSAPSEAVPADIAPEPSGPGPESATDDGTTLQAGLEKTRGGFVARIGRLFSGRTTLDADLVEELEEVLFTADIGVKTSHRLMEAVQERLGTGEIEDTGRVWDVLRSETAAILGATQGRLDPSAGPRPFVVLMVGVNGAGKTTTIGKLAAQYEARGLKVLMVAGDTFRAAAVDQLEEWSTRVGCAFHRGADEADPSSVVFDGLTRGAAEGFDVVLCDTAGRLQTKKPLMDELQKIARVAGKAVDGAPHETVLVLDANTGQNAIQQAKLFREAVPLTGVVLTKLDGTAKGGVVIGLSEEMSLPIYHIGIGESVSDLRAFDPVEFVDALF